MRTIHHSLLSAAFAAGVLAAGVSAAQAEGGGYDLGGIASAHGPAFAYGHYHGQPYRYGPGPGAWGGPYAADPYAYGYRCPRRAVAVQLPNGRVVMRRIRAC
jgi:hypothetical protein